MKKQLLTQIDIQALINAMKQIFTTKDDLDKGLKPIKTSLRSLRKDQKVTIKFFDRVTINQEKRIKRVEHHLDLPQFAD